MDTLNISILNPRARKFLSSMEQQQWIVVNQPSQVEDSSSDSPDEESELTKLLRSWPTTMSDEQYEEYLEIHKWMQQWPKRQF